MSVVPLVTSMSILRISEETSQVSSEVLRDADVSKMRLAEFHVRLLFWFKPAFVLTTSSSVSELEMYTIVSGDCQWHQLPPRRHPKPRYFEVVAMPNLSKRLCVGNPPLRFVFCKFGKGNGTEEALCRSSHEANQQRPSEARQR